MKITSSLRVFCNKYTWRFEVKFQFWHLSKKFETSQSGGTLGNKLKMATVLGVEIDFRKFLENSFVFNKDEGLCESLLF